MSDAEMLTTVDGQMLAAAFPEKYRAAAITAGADAAALRPRQWTERFSVQVEGEQALIPASLHLSSDEAALPERSEAWQLNGPPARGAESRWIRARCSTDPRTVKRL